MSLASRLLVIGLAALLAGAGPVGSALAAGGGGENSSNKKTSSSADDYIEAQKLVQAGDYDEAIELFEEILEDEPGNADVLNYLGYSHRKLGETDEALDYYLAALKSEPEHVGANEYLGELYLELGDLAKAEERLSVLQRACSGCMEEHELAQKISMFKGS